MGMDVIGKNPKAPGWDRRLNAEGTARTCETAIKANGMRPIRG